MEKIVICWILLFEIYNCFKNW